MTLSLTEKQLGRQLNFEEDVLSIFKEHSQTELQKLTIEKAFAENWQESFYLQEETFRGQVLRGQEIPEYKGQVTKLIIPGIFVVVSLDKIRKMVIDLQPQFLSKGYLLFATDYNHLENQGKAILVKGENPYDILTIQLVDAANYDLCNRDIVNRLQQWAQICSFQIIGADADWIDLQFQTLPENLKAFAEEIYEFCPDTIEQGYVGESLREDGNWEDLAAAIEEQTSEDLANYLERHKNIFLWWD